MRIKPNLYSDPRFITEWPVLLIQRLKCKQILLSPYTNTCENCWGNFGWYVVHAFICPSNTHPSFDVRNADLRNCIIFYYITMFMKCFIDVTSCCLQRWMWQEKTMRIPIIYSVHDSYLEFVIYFSSFIASPNSQ